jgi:starch synthase (maltosyl-transferring)
MITRLPILDIRPIVDGGRWPARAVTGEAVTISAVIFQEGHGRVGANVVLRGPTGIRAPWNRLRPLASGLDRWGTTVVPTDGGSWSFRIEAWHDPVETWATSAAIKIAADVDAELMLAEGALLFDQAGRDTRRSAADRELLRDTAGALRDLSRPAEVRFAAAVTPRVRDIWDRAPLRSLVCASQRHHLWVDRERALFGSWYEMFPRSEGARVDLTGSQQSRSGTFATAADRLPAIAAAGFDVVYVPPIHPIGRSHRKGANNAVTAHHGDPGSPWAIGSAEGGHDAIHPDLGGVADFEQFVARTRELGMEVALDLALQASPDHPWIRDHPEWFTHRADGTIAYAENPPKKYQDIVPLTFDTTGPRDVDGLWQEVLRLVRHWMAHGIRIFRVDNPHTKPVVFWEWLIGQIRATDPDVLFLAEAFTRPAMMHTLAKVGFHQSYTYFTWRTSKWELEDYFRELSGPAADYMRPNCFTNTPDILPENLQHGGRAAFQIRATLAATLSPTWGIYAGFELMESVAVQPGSEEYLDSEKYQLRPRPWEEYDPGGPRAGRSIAPYVTVLNRIRRAHPALQRLRGLTFHTTDDDTTIVYSKTEPITGDTILVVVNLDAFGPQETTVHLDMPALGLDWADTFRVHDLLTDARYRWGQHNYVRLDPTAEVAHILVMERVSTAGKSE